MNDLSWIPGTVIGAGGLIVAAISVILSYRERTSRLRELLYDRKAQACHQLLEALWEIRTSAWLSIHGQNGPLNDETRRKLEEAWRPHIGRVFRIQHEQSLFLPDEVIDAFRDYVRVLLALSSTSAEEAKRHRFRPELVQSKKPIEELDTAFSKLLQMMRRSLGVEPLTEQTLKLLGQTTEERQQPEPGRP
jgi:hypothetical protein